MSIVKHCTVCIKSTGCSIWQTLNWLEISTADATKMKKQKTTIFFVADQKNNEIGARDHTFLIRHMGCALLHRP